MRQVFRTRPWVLPKEPERFVEIFKKHGKEVAFPKDGFIPHGGKDGQTSFLLDGLVTFSFIDANSVHRIFAIILPGRTMGDLDALNPDGTNVLVECIRPSRVLIMDNKKWRECMRESIENMELYADLSILKEESILEGTLANYTLDLDTRLRVLILSIFQGSGVTLSTDAYNECPLALTVTEFARIVGANRSWVSTKFSEWAEAGLIRKTNRTIACRADLFEPVHDWMHRPDNVRPTSIFLK